MKACYSKPQALPKTPPILLAVSHTVLFLAVASAMNACRAPTRVTSIDMPIEGTTGSVVEPIKEAAESSGKRWLRKPFTETELGISIYPSAKPVEDATFEMFIPSQLRGYTRRYLHAAYESTDSYSRVLTWYLAALRERNVKVDEFKASNGMNAILRIESATDKWVISLQQIEGRHGTVIIIKRVL